MNKLVSVFQVVALLIAAARTTQGDWQVWTVTDTRRVLPDEPAGATVEARLAVARNQSRGFQILVRSDTPVDGVRVEAGDLQGPGGCVLRAATARLYRQHQIELTTPTVRNDHFKPGWYPDALIPFEHPLTRAPLLGARLVAVPFNLPAHETHGFWVDLYASPEVKPGEYRGVYRVTADGEKTFSVPVVLTVWDFQLPTVPTLRTAFGSPADGLRVYCQRRAKQGKEKAPADWEAVDTQCAELLSRHRINATPPPLAPAEQADGTFRIPGQQIAALRTFVDRYHINAMQVIHPDHAVKDPVAQRERLRAWLKSFDEAAAELDRPGVLFYTYLKDEPSTAADYKYVQTWGRAVREAKSVVKVLVVEQPNPENPAWGNLYGAVDIWCPLFSLFEPKPVEERLALGETVWTYTALCQEKPTPWWHIDYPLLNYRVPAWIAWRYRVSGILYWSMAYWTQVDDPWTDPKTWRPDGTRIYNGEGTLVYPGRAVGYDGIAPSLRLKALRDSVDDYEYLATVQRLGLAVKAEKIVLPLAGSWFQWDPDPATYEIARVKLAKMIVSAQGGNLSGDSTGPADAEKEPKTRVRAKVDAQWKFLKGDMAGAERVDYDDRNWQEVNLPHDWTIEGPVNQSNRRYNGFFPSGIGWYRKSLMLDGSFADRQVCLEFEGVYRNSTLWVNGQKVGSHLSGYTGIVYDITPTPVNVLICCGLRIYGITPASM